MNLPSASPWLCLLLQVLKIDSGGHQRLAAIKRRDLLRANRLQPRDLRRFDPSLGLNKSSDITIKENVLLITLGGIRQAEIL